MDTAQEQSRFYTILSGLVDIICKEKAGPGKRALRRDSPVADSKRGMMRRHSLLRTGFDYGWMCGGTLSSSKATSSGSMNSKSSGIYKQMIRLR